MDRVLIRTFCLDGDSCQVEFLYDAACGKHLGEYPDFEESPRYTPGGHPWVTAMQEGCNHGRNQYAQGQQCMDCGSCEYFLQEQEHDLMGICTHPDQLKPVKDTGERERISSIG